MIWSKCPVVLGVAIAMNFATGAVPPSELSALSDLYFATGGNSSWINQTGWRTLDADARPRIRRRMWWRRRRPQHI